MKVLVKDPNPKVTNLLITRFCIKTDNKKIQIFFIFLLIDNKSVDFCRLEKKPSFIKSSIYFFRYPDGVYRVCLGTVDQSGHQSAFKRQFWSLLKAGQRWAKEVGRTFWMWPLCLAMRMGWESKESFLRDGRWSTDSKRKGQWIKHSIKEGKKVSEFEEEEENNDIDTVDRAMVCEL